ncbi:MAG: cysteine desulfurase-like protein [Acidimicrobiia bacterium]|nr:cysteine desulfurase-like protein [Acidimicrobiia bacterium]
MDTDHIRSQFPALERTHHGRQVMYFDGAAGTQAPTAVIDAISNTLRAGISNHGEPAASSRFSDAIVMDARSAVADLYNASPDEIVFAQNMTSHTFALSRALATTWTEGDEIVLTRMDHDANIAPWLRVAGERGVTVRWVDFADYRLDPDSFSAVLGPRTRLIAVTAASNALGTVVDIPAVAERVRSLSPALLFVDAVHCAPHRSIDVKAWDADFLVASAYKFYGPHIGALYARSEHLAALPAYKVRPAPETGPDRWETGTQSFETIAGVTAAIDYLATLGDGETRREQLQNTYLAIGAHEQVLADRFLAGVAELEHVTVYGLTEGDRTSTFSIAVDGLTDEQVAVALADQGIFVSHGTYYAVEVLKSLGQTGLTRIGFVHYNTTDEVDAVLSALDALA